METVALADGDLRWVFPELADQAQVLDVLRRAAACVEQLSGRLGARWTTNGLEFQRFPDRPGTVLAGYVDTGDVSFAAELWPPKDQLGWVVDASISVRCAAAADCGTHPVEAMPESAHGTPVDAANALLAAAAWLLRRGAEEPAGAWRRRDPGC